MNKSPIEIAVGQTNILIEDEVCKAVGKVGIHINKEELLKALKAYEFVEELTNYIFEYPDDDYMTMECLCRKLVKHGLLDKVDGYYQTHEIRTNTHECVKTNADQHVQRVEYVGNVKRCRKCKHIESEHQTPIASDGKYYTYVVCTAKECNYEPKDEPQTNADQHTQDVGSVGSVEQTERSE